GGLGDPAPLARADRDPRPGTHSWRNATATKIRRLSAPHPGPGARIPGANRRMDRDRGIRGERPRRVSGGVPRDRARGDRLRAVLLPVARGALVLAWRWSHRAHRRGASV